MKTDEVGQQNSISQRGYFTTPCWKKTSLGTAIELYSSHPLGSFELDRSLRPILLMGGIHGDEPEGVRLAQDTLAYLQEATARGEKLTPWILIPCLNVDGFNLKQRVNGRGVDLNRNYPASNWSAEFTKPRYCPGPFAASEIEVASVVALIEAISPRLLIHCHSWEPCIVATGISSKVDAIRLANNSGYKSVDEIGYPTPGSLSRFGWIDHRIPVICIEEQEGQADLSTIWPRFSEAMGEIFQDPSPRLSLTHLIFDLDDTLLDTSGQLIPKASLEACLAMVKAGLNCSEDECLKERDRFLVAHRRHDLYHHLVNRFGVRKDCDRTRDEIKNIGTTTFYARDIGPELQLFPDSMKMLERLKTKYTLHLVTSGNPATQKRKVEILKIQSLFSSLHFADSNILERKTLAFEKILTLTNADPGECISIGNRLDSEISDAKKLGMKTCWIRFGEDSQLEPKTTFETPDFCLTSVGQLEAVCPL